MKQFLICAFMGFLALGLVNLSAGLTGIGLAVSCLSIAAAGLLGVPGVALLVLLSAIL